MSHYFNFEIQVLHGKMWVTVLHLETKTGCFGHPLETASMEANRKHRFIGNYGADYLQAQTCSDRFSALGLYTSPPIDASKLEAKGHDLDEDQDKPKLIYYSIDQLRKLITYIDPLLNNSDPRSHYFYNQLMAPVPMWMEMAKSAHPVEWMWMSNKKAEIDKMTERLRQAQIKFAEVHKNLMMRLLCKLNIPTELISLIADSAKPLARDVRFVWPRAEELHRLVEEFVSSVVNIFRNDYRFNHRR